MKTVFVRAELKSEYLKTFLNHSREDAQGSVKNEPDCLRFDIFQDDENPNIIYFYEAYKNQAAFDHHLTTPHFQKWQEGLRDEWFVIPLSISHGKSVIE